MLNTRKRPRKLEENNHVFISDIVMTMGVDMRLNSSLTGALSAGTQQWQCRAWPPESELELSTNIREVFTVPGEGGSLVRRTFFGHYQNFAKLSLKL